MTIQEALVQLAVYIVLGMIPVSGTAFYFARRYLKIRADRLEDRLQEERKRAESAAQARKLEYERQLADLKVTQELHQEARENDRANREILKNLTEGVLQIAQRVPAEIHAVENSLSNNTQTLGDMAEYMDRLAMNVSEHADASRAARDASLKGLTFLELIAPNIDRAIEYLSEIRELAKATHKHKTGELVQVAGGLVQGEPEA